VYRRTRTVPKHIELEVLGLALSAKQIPQIVENSQSGTERMEPLEGTGVRTRQMRCQVVRRFWGDNMGFSAGRFEDHLIGGATRFWRRGLGQTEVEDLYPPSLVTKMFSGLRSR
jgi:hypothetical protein